MIRFCENAPLVREWNKEKFGGKWSLQNHDILLQTMNVLWSMIPPSEQISTAFHPTQSQLQSYAWSTYSVAWQYIIMMLQFAFVTFKLLACSCILTLLPPF